VVVVVAEKTAERGKEKSTQSTMVERKGKVSGGFWALEFTRNIMYGKVSNDNVVPCDISSVSLALTMAEKCEILKGMGTNVYRRLEDYISPSYINSWEMKTTGEVGPLELRDKDDDD
jgi:hypothetical protein